MAELENRYSQTGTTTRTGVAVDEGLRSHMLGVYNYMALGVAFTGVVSYLTYYLAATVPAVAQVLYTPPINYVLMFAPLAFVLLLNFTFHKLSVAGTHAAFWAFATIMGISLSTIFLAFTGQSIVQLFFVTAAAFAGLSLWGYTTKKDISGWGSFLIMGVVGVIVAMIANLFLQSSALHFAISVIGLLVFAGLTAYDTQRIKDEYLMIRHDATAVAKSAISGALHLYLDFINMFIFILNLFGSSE